MADPETRQRSDALRLAMRNAGGMTTAAATHHLAVIARSATGQPRTLRLQRLSQPAASKGAAYRRITAVILRLDVPTLAFELRRARTRPELRQARAA